MTIVLFQQLQAKEADRNGEKGRTRRKHVLVMIVLSRSNQSKQHPWKRSLMTAPGRIIVVEIAKPDSDQFERFTRPFHNVRSQNYILLVAPRGRSG